MIDILEKIKPLADPQYYINEEIDEEAMYHWWYKWDYKKSDEFFTDIWEIRYDDILKQMVYYCGESAFEYAFNYFHDILKNYIIDCFIYDYTSNASKSIKEYFLQNRQEIFSPNFEKYPKSWKTVFRDLPPNLEYVNKIFNYTLSEYIEKRITDMYNKKEINFLMRTRKCIISGELFTDSVGTSFKIRSPIRKIEWELQDYKPQIAPWLFDNFRRLGDNSDVKKSIPYLRQLLDLFGYIPPKDCTTYSLFCNMPKHKYIDFIKLQPNIFYFSWYSDLYGSWLNAIKETGYLGDNEVIRSSFGYRAIAKDGHVCNSLAEKNIDDWLYSHQIEHTKEPAYPDSVRNFMKSKVRADWKVGNTFIEYFGLQSEKDYAKKTSAKILACNILGIDLKALYPGDEYHLDTILKDYIKGGNFA
jgi:hypothetical protein